MQIVKSKQNWSNFGFTGSAILEGPIIPDLNICFSKGKILTSNSVECYSLYISFKKEYMWIIIVNDHEYFPLIKENEKDIYNVFSLAIKSLSSDELISFIKLVSNYYSNNGELNIKRKLKELIGV